MKKKRREQQLITLAKCYLIMLKYSKMKPLIAQINQYKIMIKKMATYHAIVNVHVQDQIIKIKEKKDFP